MCTPGPHAGSPCWCCTFGRCGVSNTERATQAPNEVFAVPSTDLPFPPAFETCCNHTTSLLTDRQKVRKQQLMINAWQRRKQRLETSGMLFLHLGHSDPCAFKETRPKVASVVRSRTRSSAIGDLPIQTAPGKHIMIGSSFFLAQNFLAQQRVYL